LAFWARYFFKGVAFGRRGNWLSPSAISFSLSPVINRGMRFFDFESALVLSRVLVVFCGMFTSLSLGLLFILFFFFYPGRGFSYVTASAASPLTTFSFVCVVVLFFFPMWLGLPSRSSKQTMSEAIPPKGGTCNAIRVRTLNSSPLATNSAPLPQSPHTLTLFGKSYRALTRFRPLRRRLPRSPSSFLPFPMKITIATLHAASSLCAAAWELSLRKHPRQPKPHSCSLLPSA